MRRGNAVAFHTCFTALVNIQHPGQARRATAGIPMPRALSNLPDYKPDARPRSAVAGSGDATGPSSAPEGEATRAPASAPSSNLARDIYSPEERHLLTAMVRP
jgi:hypothetical protein